MELIIDEEKAKVAKDLIDVTDLGTPIRYMEQGFEGIQFLFIVQDGYEMHEVVSPLMVRVEDPDTTASPLLPPEKHPDYAHKLMQEGVVRMVVPEDIIKTVHISLEKFVDAPSVYDPNESCRVILLSPIYWIKLTGGKHE